MTDQATNRAIAAATSAELVEIAKRWEKPFTSYVNATKEDVAIMLGDIHRLLGYVERLRANAIDWIRVDDRLPEIVCDETHCSDCVLAWDGELSFQGFYLAPGWGTPSWHWANSPSLEVEGVTHWAVIPEWTEITAATQGAGDGD